MALPSAAQARYASIVVDAASGRILHARNIDTRLYPASMTKMMTLYLLFEALDRGKLSMSSLMQVSARAAGQAPSKLGLRAGSTISVSDAMKALATKSANDVATVIAEALGGTEIQFAHLMTERARTLGMTHTTFRNASGLPNSGQKSTARDMAILALSLQQHFPQYYKLFSTTKFRYGGHVYGTHNHLMTRYPGADGLKTGYIRAAGFNLAFSAVRNGHRLVGVVFGGRTARSRDDHMAQLMDAAFAKVTGPGYVSYASGGSRVTVVARPSVPRAPAPIPPALPPGKDGIAVAEAAPVTTPVATPTVVSLGLVASASAAVPVTAKDASANDAAPRPVARPTPPGSGATVVSLAEARAAASLAPVPPIPPLPVGVPTGDSKDGNEDGSWGIQVGAFSTQRTAERVAHESARLLDNRMDAVNVRVIPHTVDDGRVFRARLVGMPSEEQARSACDALKAHGRSCLVVVPSGWTVASR